jgi:protein involved in plasmid replication-relaxation
MTAALSFRITERDLGMLQAIARYRFLTAGLLQHIVGGSRRGVRNRLRMLSALAYLVCLKSVVTEPFTYGLGNKGARLLADRGSLIDHRLDWTAENERTRYFIDHTLAVAETMLRFQFATRDRAVRLVDHHELLPDMSETTRSARDPFCLRVTIRHHDKALTIPVVPDRLFAFAYPDNTTHNFALELDRGTMDIWANRLVGKSSIRRKLIGYFHGREQKRIVEKWGFKSFRVLTVTTSDSRIESMLRTQRRVAADCPPGLFLYSTPERIERHGALGRAWITSKSDNVSLSP